jgi:hypothetical protein
VTAAKLSLPLDTLERDLDTLSKIDVVRVHRVSSDRYDVWILDQAGDNYCSVVGPRATKSLEAELQDEADHTFLPDFIAKYGRELRIDSRSFVSTNPHPPTSREKIRESPVNVNVNVTENVNASVTDRPEVQEVWSEWVRQCEKNDRHDFATTPNQKRAETVVYLLDSGKSVATLKRALIGIWEDQWFRDNNKISFEAALRSEENIERFAAQAKPPDFLRDSGWGVVDLGNGKRYFHAVKTRSEYVDKWVAEKIQSGIPHLHWQFESDGWKG